MPVSRIVWALSIFALVGVLMANDDDATTTAAFAVVPQLGHVVPSEGSFTISADTVISAGSGAGQEAELFAEQLVPAMGFKLAVDEKSTPSRSVNGILMKLDPDTESLGEEGYRLKIEPKNVEISAYRPAGLFYACQTVRQLLPAEAMGSEVVTGAEWEIPCGTIEDSPRFAWRGHLFDTARHFFTVDEIKRSIDLISMQKLNVFHWHLVDDQGWRLEIKRYPKLTSVGGWRNDPQAGRYGGFYTQEQVRDVVAYAARRHVTVVPEIEMPGHSIAALTSYPELGCTGGPYEVRTEWGISKDVYCAGQEQTYQFVYNVLDEVMALFPSQYIHIGGDECPKDRWKECPKCQARIKAEGLKDEAELQSYFVRRVDKYLSEHGRRLVGWDEILEGGLAPGAVVQAWRNVKHAQAAASEGHAVILSPTSHCYLDYTYEKTPLEKTYSYDPMPPGLSPDQEKLVLGVEGNLWTERVPNVDRYDFQAYPRLSALAEVGWSQADQRNWEDFSGRLEGLEKRFDVMGVKYAVPDEITSGTVKKGKFYE